MSKQLETASHDFIRYANCWEDADILLEALQVQADERVFSIGSAGDNSFSMLINNPEMVLAVDINEAQLHLIELKKAAFQVLNYSEFLQFLGFNESKNRFDLYERVKANLPADSIDYWSQNLAQIQQGIIYQGKFEKYFGLFRKKVLPLVQSKRNVDELFREKSNLEQRNFFEKHWNNWRWRALFKIFFSKFVMGRFGRDPAFLKEVKIPVSTFILRQSQRHLSSKNCQRNYFLYFIMNGRFNSDLPHYARPENFDKIKANVSRLNTFKGFAEEAFKTHGKFDKFNLSNIFEYMSPEVFKSVADDIVNHANPNARIAYWNLMVDRKIAEVNDQVMHDGQTSENLTEIDKGFFYSRFQLCIK